jgi:pimeloyl-ACP methyl ester carboxylesterase
MNGGAALAQGWGEVKHGAFRTAFWVQGDATRLPPLVMLPSIGGGARHWGEWGRALSLGRQTIAMEPLGFGRSSAPPLGFSTRRLAKELQFALEQLALPGYDVLGVSFGALLATWLVALAPERARRLVLASCAALGRDFGPRRLATGLRLISDFLLHPRPKLAIAHDISTPDGADPQRSRADVAGVGWSRARLLRYVLAVAAHDGRPVLGHIRSPALVLHGERDVILSPASQHRLLSQLPHASYREISGAGHDLPSEAAASTAELIDSFLTTAVPCGRGGGTSHVRLVV